MTRAAKKETSHGLCLPDRCWPPDLPFAL